jgi:hypothetical protein
MKSAILVFVPLINILAWCNQMNGQILQTSVREKWVGENWQNDSKNSYTFESDYYTNRLDQMWDVNALLWKNHAQTIYINDINGQRIEENYQVWENETISWNDASRSSFAYSESGLLVTQVTENWANGVWQNFSKLSYTYDANGYRINYLVQYWDVLSVTWLNSYQYIYSNDSEGQTNQAIYQNWDNETSSWNDALITYYTYTESGALETEITEHWANGGWQNSTQFLYNYDSSDNLTNFLIQNWNLFNGWENSWVYNYTYNPDSTPSIVISQAWDDSTVTWVNYSRLTHTWLNESTSLPQLGDEHNVNLYPNPSSNFIECNIAESISKQNYYITDFSGRILEVGMLTAGIVKLDISELPSGVYLFMTQGLCSKFVKN